MSSIPACLSMREILFARDKKELCSMRFRNLACPSSVAPHLETSSLEKKNVPKIHLLFPGAAQNLLKRCHSIWIGFGDRWIMSMLGTQVGSGNDYNNWSRV